MAGETGFLQLYLDIPVITRIYTTACLLVTLATNFEFVSQYHIYLNAILIVEKYQVWRAITTFLYAGPFSFGTLFNLLFSYRYSRILEEQTFHRRASDCCFMYIFFVLLILTISITCTNLVFLGHSLTHAILYLWCRRNPRTRVIIFGLFTLQADQVPYVLIGLSLATGTPLTADVVAFVAGHAYYFLEDVFPKQQMGFRILKTPRILKALFDELPEPESELIHERINAVDENNNNLVNNNDGLGNPELAGAGDAAVLLNNENNNPIANNNAAVAVGPQLAL